MNQASNRTNQGRILTQDYLKSVLHYEPETGIFTWLVSSGKALKGSKAGWFKKEGYIEIKVDGAAHLAHRLAHLYMTGTWPAEQIDHIDTVKSHNWWSNLRSATHQQNQFNREKQRRNSSGYKGVSLVPCTGRYRAQMTLNNKRVHLGNRATAYEASLLYIAAAKQHHGEFYRAN